MFGALADLSTDSGMTAAAFAVLGGNVHALSLILSAGARVDSELSPTLAHLFFAPVGCPTFMHLAPKVDGWLESAQQASGARGDAAHSPMVAPVELCKRSPLRSLALGVAEGSRLKLIVQERLNRIDIIAALKLSSMSRCAPCGSCSLLSFAELVASTESATDVRSAAELVLQASRWSPKSHHLFPSHTRALALDLVRISVQLSYKGIFCGVESALQDVWIMHIIPLVATRQGQTPVVVAPKLR